MAVTRAYEKKIIAVFVGVTSTYKMDSYICAGIHGMARKEILNLERVVSDQFLSIQNY